MSALAPDPPFVWPEPRALEGICSYEHQPPIQDLALQSRAAFGTVEKALIVLKDRCELTYRIIDAVPVESVKAALKEKEAA